MLRNILIALLAWWYQGRVFPPSDDDFVSRPVCLNRDSSDTKRIGSFSYNPFLLVWWTLCGWAFDTDVKVLPSIQVPGSQGVFVQQNLPAGSILVNYPWREKINDGAMVAGVPPNLNNMIAHAAMPAFLRKISVPQMANLPAMAFLRDTTCAEWKSLFEKYCDVPHVVASINVRTVVSRVTNQVFQQTVRDVEAGEELLTYYTAPFWIQQFFQGIIVLPIPAADDAQHMLDVSEKFQLPLLEFLRNDYNVGSNVEAQMLKPARQLWTNQALFEREVVKATTDAVSCPIQ